MRVGLIINTSNNKINYKKNWYKAIQGNATSSVRNSRHSQHTYNQKSSKSIIQSHVNIDTNSMTNQIKPIDNDMTDLQTSKINKRENSNKKNSVVISDCNNKNYV